MTRDEFEGPAELLDRLWPGEFTDKDATAYYFVLDDFSADAVMSALRAVCKSGQKFRPAASELVAVLTPERAAQPTFGEMFQLLFGPRGALTARGVDGTRARLADMHPLVAAFAERSGIQRLKELPVHDLDEGHWRKDDLEREWNAHVEACERRGVAAVAAGGGSGDLRKFDPLAALGIGQGPQINP